MVIFYDLIKFSDISSVAENLKLKQPRIGHWDKTNPNLTNVESNYLADASEYFISYTKGKKGHLIPLRVNGIMLHIKHQWLAKKK